MEISPRLLRLIVLLDRSGSMTQTGAELGMTQPAVSMQLQRAERSLGFEVFERSARGVSATARGRLLCDAAQEVLRGLQRLDGVVDAIRRDSAHVLRVGCVAYGGGEVMTRILSDFARRHPEATIERQQCGFEDHIGGLSDGAVDVAFGFGLVTAADLVVEPLFADPPVLAVPSASRWARRGSIEVREILDEPLLAGDGPGDGWEDYWLASSHRGGREPRITGRFNTVELHLDAVARGVGLSIMSVQTQRHYRHAGVAFVPLRGLEPVTHWLAWRRDSPSRYTSALVESARHVARRDRALSPRQGASESLPA